MRILSWNINGQRTLRGYRPWYSLKKWHSCLDFLGADIICFQEVKMTRKSILMERDMCLPEGYEAYYNLHPTKGYSGVATFVKTSTCQVQKAELGLTGELAGNRKSGDQQLIESTCIGGYPDEHAPESPHYEQIDMEGRCVIIDCGLFVLFNLYCPNETDEARRDYKMAFYNTLEERVNNLLIMGRQIIIVGDMNIAHLPIDHCESVNQRTMEEHLAIHPARQWLHRFLAPNGQFHDTTRDSHPTRQFMYTCWNTLKDTRPANYGVRIDYTLVSGGLLPWVKDSNIQPNIFGSDHCPIFLDLHDSIQCEDGRTIQLRDQMMSWVEKKHHAPSIATCNWPEFAGRRIQSFFAPKARVIPESRLIAKTSSDDNLFNASKVDAETTAPLDNNAFSTDDIHEVHPHESSSLERSVIPAALNEQSTRRFLDKCSNQELTHPSKSSFKVQTKSSKAASTAGQTKLRAFFAQPATSMVHSSVSQKGSSGVSDSQQEPARFVKPKTNEVGESSVRSPLKRKGSEIIPERNEPSDIERVNSALAWGSIFAPKEPPLCSGHFEPARAWTVNKAGPNHGRKFWMCSRPVGSAGTGNPADDLQFRCDFWKWDSDIRKRQRRQDRDMDGSARIFHDVAGSAPRLGSGERRGPENTCSIPPHKSSFSHSK